MKLSEADRLMIAEQLWLSASGEKQQEMMDEVTNEPEFRAELERRLKKVNEHPERLLDGQTVMAELREHLRKKREQ
jgi:hypothetical protein